MLSGRVRKKFVANISVDLDRIRNRQWNVERLIIFKLLFRSASDWYLAQEIHVTGFYHVMIYEKKAPTKSLYRTPMVRWQPI